MQKDLNGTNVKSLGHEILIKKAYDSVKPEVLYNSLIAFIIYYFLWLCSQEQASSSHEVS
jgi:hypothetical protein